MSGSYDYLFVGTKALTTHVITGISTGIPVAPLPMLWAAKMTG